MAPEQTERHDGEQNGHPTAEAQPRRQAVRLLTPQERDAEKQRLASAPDSWVQIPIPPEIVRAQRELETVFSAMRQDYLRCMEKIQPFIEEIRRALTLFYPDPAYLELLHHALTLCRKEAPKEARWASAQKFVERLSPRLGNYAAWRELCRRAKEDGKAPEALLATWLFPEGALLAAEGADEPREVRLGAEWVTDENGHKTRVSPALDLPIGDFIRWLRQEVYAQASEILLEPIAAGDALDDAGAGLDPDREAAPAPCPRETDANTDPIDILMEAASPSKRRLLRLASPDLIVRYRMALNLLRDGMAGEGVEALHNLGMSDNVIRKTRERLRERAGGV